MIRGRNVCAGLLLGGGLKIIKDTHWSNGGSCVSVSYASSLITPTTSNNGTVPASPSLHGKYPSARY